MKKILFSLLAIVGLLSSCTNDDINIGHEVAFTINPSTVVDNLVEYEPGELTVLPKGFSVRVRLFIYDKEGLLVAHATKDFSDYSHLMSSTQNLPNGKYTVVATTNITDGSNDFAWIFSNTDNINSFKISDDGYIRQQWGILGISSSSLNVTDNTREFKLDVMMAGALAFVQYKNYNYYSNVNAYKLLSNKRDDYVSFNSNGEVQYSYISESTYSYRLSRVKPDSNYGGAYRYIFMFPKKDAKFQFACEIGTDDNYKTYTIGTECIDDILQAREYYFSIDIATGEAEWAYLTDFSRAIKSTNQLEQHYSNNKEQISFDKINVETCDFHSVVDKIR